MESQELLKAENERLVAEMATMKKKIKIAMKKQQADLQAKVQAAEQRAAAAEASAAVKAGNGLAQAVEPHVKYPTSLDGGVNGSSGGSPPSHLHQSMQRKSSASSEANNGEVAHSVASSFEVSPDNGDSRTAVDRLQQDLKAEIEANQRLEEAAARERQRLEDEIAEMKKTSQSLLERKNQEIAEFEEKLKTGNESSEQRIEQLTKANERLEGQLLAAAEQVAGAYARMSASQEDLERVSREGNEANRAHANLASEHKQLATEHDKILLQHKSLSEELEQTNTAFSEAQRMLREKTKEIEELTAARKAAQEGQEAAMRQLMSRLAEMEANRGDQVREADKEAERKSTEANLNALSEENVNLQQELEKRGEVISSLTEEICDLQQRLSLTESESLSVAKIGESDKNLQRDLQTSFETLLREHEELKSQLAVGRSLQLDEIDSDGSKTAVSNNEDSREDVSFLKKKVEESSSALQKAEEEINHLSTARLQCLEEIQSLSDELGQARTMLETEIKSRDEKYAELDAKFGRLQKRAKQRIQEVQKEKEDVEVRIAVAGEKAAEALSKQANLQDELDRARVQAGEALRSLSAERQELRMTNKKLKDEVEEARRMLEAKEHNLAESRRIASEKDQISLETTNQLREAQESHEGALTALREKHQKTVEDLSRQIAEGVAENIKLAETISGLQAAIAMKESRFAELEAASSGEVVRLGASLEAARGEVSRHEQEQKKEQEAWQASIDKVEKKLQSVEQSLRQQEKDAAEMRSQLEAELEKKRQTLSTVQADLASANEQAARVANDLAAYKVRAYALLQRKEAELSAAKDVEFAAAQESALKEAKREAAAAAMERDIVRKKLQEAISEYETKLAARAVSLMDAEQRIKDTAIKLELTKAQTAADLAEWQSRLGEVEASWRLRLETLEGKTKDNATDDMRREYTTLLNEYDSVKGELISYREMVEKVVEDKDLEITRLLEENSTIQKLLQQQDHLTREQNTVKASGQNSEAYSALDAPSIVGVEEHHIVLLARQQAQREEEVSQSRRHIQALQEEIAELEKENRLHNQQESLLKEEVRNLERAHKREGVDMTYLKNVIVNLIETGEVEALLPVIAMLLQFSPDELKRCHDAYKSAPTDDKSNRTPAGPETSTSSSFFSKLITFS